MRPLSPSFDILDAGAKPEYYKVHYSANKSHLAANQSRCLAKKAAAEALAQNEHAKKLRQQLDREKQIKEQNQLSTKPAPKPDHSGKLKQCAGCKTMKTRDKFLGG